MGVGVCSNTFESCFFYRFLANKKGAKFGVTVCSVLAVPYLLIVLSYVVLRSNSLMNIPIDFWFEWAFANIWFLIGPVLVFRFMKLFMGLNQNNKLTPSLRKWFQTNSQIHYKIYKRSMFILSPIFIVIAVPILIYEPDILIRIAGITVGYRDIYYWLIIAFLSWFLIYCTNAISVVTMMAVVVYRIKKQNAIAFNPTEESHHICVREILGFSNRIVSYMCSGLLFLPTAFFFLRQQVYIEWVTALLVFYSLFLFAAITYPKMTIKSYIDIASKDYCLKEKTRYFKEIQSDQYQIDKKRSRLAFQLQRYNFYCYIQELKTVCPLKMGIDSNAVVTYLSILVTLATSVPGFIGLFTSLIP